VYDWWSCFGLHLGWAILTRKIIFYFCKPITVAFAGASRDRSVYYVTYGVKGNLAEAGPETRRMVHSQSLYRAYYELYDAWIAADYPQGSAADELLGPGRSRPSLVPRSAMGVGAPTPAVSTTTTWR
jgi:hypothetical protein